MNVRIESSNIDLNDAVCEQVKGPIASALGKYSDCINGAVVHVEAVGELGGDLSLACQIDLDLKPSGTLTTQAIHENVDIAISRAAHQMKHRLEVA